MADSSVAVSNHLTVKDIAQAMSFYDRVFGFKRKMALPGPGGRIMHGEMTYQGCTIMLGPESLQHGMRAPVTLGGTPVSIFLYVDDVDAIYALAQQNAAHILQSPNDQFFGCRTFVMLDPDGHQWMVAQQQKDMTVEEIEGALSKEHQPPYQGAPERAG